MRDDRMLLLCRRIPDAFFDYKAGSGFALNSAAVALRRRTSTFGRLDEFARSLHALPQIFGFLFSGLFHGYRFEAVQFSRCDLIRILTMIS